MRTLKFRAWDNVRKRYLTEEDGLQLSLDGSCVIFTDGGWYAPDITLEQYTGLQDRGVEIYEGDIIRWANSVGREITAPVVWNTRSWCWTAGDYMLGGLLEFDLEVVGNIHEDLKLLEAK